MDCYITMASGLSIVFGFTHLVGPSDYAVDQVRTIMPCRGGERIALNPHPFNLNRQQRPQLMWR